MFGWKFWGVSSLYAALAAVVIGVPTVLIPNHLFMRMTPTSPVDYAIWAASSLLMGPLFAIMTLYPASTCAPRPSRRASGQATAGTITTAAALPGMSPCDNMRVTLGGILSFFSVGCPVCNKIVLFFLGASGAMTVFNPLRPFLGAGALVLLAVTLYLRVRVLLYGCPVAPQEALATTAPPELP
jgi:hypothetical protein